MVSEPNKPFFFSLPLFFLGYFSYSDSNGAHNQPSVVQYAIMNYQAIKLEERK